MEPIFSHRERNLCFHVDEAFAFVERPPGVQRGMNLTYPDDAAGNSTVFTGGAASLSLSACSCRSRCASGLRPGMQGRRDDAIMVTSLHDSRIGIKVDSTVATSDQTRASTTHQVKYACQDIRIRVSYALQTSLAGLWPLQGWEHDGKGCQQRELDCWTFDSFADLSTWDFLVTWLPWRGTISMTTPTTWQRPNLASCC